MKKILIFLFLLIITGCSNTNTPTMEVTKLFTNYNSQNSEVLRELDKVLYSEDLTEEQKEEYKDILKKQYSDLKYSILSEVIDNDTAIVSVEIEVYNYKEIIDEVNKKSKEEFTIDGEYDKNLFIDYKINKLKEQTKRIKYTLDLSLTKIDNKWYLNDLLESDRQKIHGLY